MEITATTAASVAGRFLEMVDPDIFYQAPETLPAPYRILAYIARGDEVALSYAMEVIAGWEARKALGEH